MSPGFRRTVSQDCRGGSHKGSTDIQGTLSHVQMFFLYDCSFEMVLMKLLLHIKTTCKPFLNIIMTIYFTLPVTVRWWEDTGRGSSSLFHYMVEWSEILHKPSSLSVEDLREANKIWWKLQRTLSGSTWQLLVLLQNSNFCYNQIN